MTLDINDLKRGGLVVIEGDPYIVLSVKHLHIGRGGASVQTKMKNLRSGKVLDRNFKSDDTFEEANIEKLNTDFIYERNGEYWFSESGNKGNRFSLMRDVIGDGALFLKPGMEVRAFI